MAVRKLNNSWWTDFHFDGRRYRKRSPDNTRHGALAYEMLLRQRLARGEPIEHGRPQRRDQTLAEFAPKWLEDYVKPNNKYSEQLKKKHILLASLIPFFGDKPIGQIKAHDIER